MRNKHTHDRLELLVACTAPSTEFTLLLLAAKINGAVRTPSLFTSRGDHVIVYALAKESMDGGLPNYQPTRLNGMGNFFCPIRKKYTFFPHFYLNSSNHALHSCILLDFFLVGKSYWIGTFKYKKNKNTTKLFTAIVYIMTSILCYVMI